MVDELFSNVSQTNIREITCIRRHLNRYIYRVFYFGQRITKINFNLSSFAEKQSFLRKPLFTQLMFFFG